MLLHRLTLLRWTKLRGNHTDRTFWLGAALLVGMVLFAGVGTASSADPFLADVRPTGPLKPASIDWTPVDVDKQFRSEGVAVADINRDGKPDITVGELWYEAPVWHPHEIYPVGEYGSSR